MRQENSLRKIALIVEGRVQYERSLLRGIRDFAADRGDWLVRLEMPGEGTMDFVEKWKPDGILFQSSGLEKSVVRKLARKKAAIHLSESPPGIRTRSVGLDNAAIGKHAAEYFSERRFSHFAFAGFSASGFSESRRTSYVGALEKMDRQVEEFDIDSMKRESDLLEWLVGLPKPCALFSTHDECSLFLTTICRSAGIRVPEEISILGVDDDRLICELAWPQLSSIAVPSRRVGREAAHWLDQLMAGKGRERSSLLLPPTGIATRHSTEVHHTEDEIVNKALRYMLSYPGLGFNVDDVVNGIGVSRRLLERRFADQLGRSPLAEIQRLRLEKAKRLLLETGMPLHEIALQCGCGDASRLVAFFRKETGTTPGKFRNAASERFNPIE